MSKKEFYVSFLEEPKKISAKQEEVDLEVKLIEEDEITVKQNQVWICLASKYYHRVTEVKGNKDRIFYYSKLLSTELRKFDLNKNEKAKNCEYMFTNGRGG